MKKFKDIYLINRTYSVNFEPRLSDVVRRLFPVRMCHGEVTFYRVGYVRCKTSVNPPPEKYKFKI